MSAGAFRVELVYDPDCPNVSATRSRLIQAFARTGASARWREWNRSAPDCPGYARGYGSPTVLVDGRDVAGTTAMEGAGACRVYDAGNGQLSAAPSLDVLCAALQSVQPVSPARTRFRAALASLPAAGAALLPKLTCPLCFPAYAAVLSAFGLEFFNYTPYLLPMTAAFLVLALAVLAWQVRRSKRVDVLLLGAAAAVVVLAGRFHAESDWIAGGGIALLVAALYLGGRARASNIPFCPSCAVDGKTLQAQAQR